MRFGDRKSCFGILLLAVLGVLATAAGPTRSLLERRLLAHVEFLASDEMAGRLIGETGDKLAERYVRTSFIESGLESPPGIDGYFQRFTVSRAELDTARTILVVRAGPRTYRFVFGRDVFCSPRGCGEVSVASGIVFAGYGIRAPEYGYDDYRGVDVRNKIVVVLNHEPGEKADTDKFMGRRPTRHSNPVLKAETAARLGAAGIVIINDALNHDKDIDELLKKRYGDRLAGPFYCLEGEEGTIPLFYATRRVARAMLSGTGMDQLELQRKIDDGMKPRSRNVPGREIELHVGIRRVTRLDVANVVGLLEGGDERLKSEYIVLAAHHDHVGSSRGVIRNGADDNASGCAGLLEAARILSRQRLGRSVLFVSFCGEEQGVLGSKYFVSRMDTAVVRLMVNLDMIGRNNMDKDENSRMFIVFTSAQTPMLEESVRSLADSLGVDVRVAPYVRFRGGSDHEPFHEAGVPVVFYFSGFHEDYHGTGDVAEKIVPGKMRIVVDHLCRLVRRLSYVGRGGLSFDRSITEEPPKDEFEKPY